MEIITFLQIVGDPHTGSLDLLTLQQNVIYIDTAASANILTFTQKVYIRQNEKNILTLRQRVNE